MGSATYRLEAISAMISSISSLTPNQLELLASTGICLTTSPATDSSEPFKLRLCSEGRRGKNKYDTVRSKSEEVLAENAVAVSKRVEKFSDWLPSKVLNHRKFLMATVCRSVRDGYTPR